MALNYQNFSSTIKTNRKKRIDELIVNPEIISCIDTNLHNMTLDEKIILLKKVASDELVNNILLTYAFSNLEINTVDNMSMKEFIKQATNILVKYYPKTGGEYFDDDYWTLYTHENTKPNDYILEAGECIFENTISYPYYANDETLRFLKNLVKNLNRLAKNIQVREKKMYIKSEHSIVVHICAVDKNVVSQDKIKRRGVFRY